MAGKKLTNQQGLCASRLNIDYYLSRGQRQTEN
jgi:hypothetical protein